MSETKNFDNKDTYLAFFLTLKKPIIQRMNNKVRKALYFIKGFLKNPHIPIPYKRLLFLAIVIEQVSYYAPLLGIKQRKNEKYSDTSFFRIILN